MTVVWVHACALYWASQQEVLPPIPQDIIVPIQAVMIMPVALPTKTLETPKQPAPPKPVAQPTIQPIVPKMPVLAPSEKAITLEKPVAVEKSEPVIDKSIPTPPVTDAPVVSKAEPPPETEITPPRSDASSLNNANPSYPAMSRRLAEQGKVLLDVLILANGTVGEIKLKQSSGFKRLDDAALQAVKQWRFQPAKRGNQAIDYWYVLPISFSLNS
ncbi:energy transducer TonB [Agitococcus lubricus]|uniref:energy transducer TonB n=1 Tax=Agitococcus lubricus TaxID=1077255 RepID=UPI00147392BB|nr:energy transducer TonB [Agitococcus lubricus]